LIKELLQYHAEAGVEVCQPAYSEGLIATITSLVTRFGDQSVPVCTINGQVDNDLRKDLEEFLAPLIRQQDALDDYNAREQAERWRQEDQEGWGGFHEDDMRNRFPDAEAYQNWIDSSD
jgi:hypothetical protein